MPLATLLNSAKTASDIAANVATAAAVVFGAIWAYWRFVRERTRWPRANLELVIAHRRLTDNTTGLNAKVKIHNAGRGLMKLRELRVDLYRVLPIDDRLRKKVDCGCLVPPGEVEAAWPVIEQHKTVWSENQPELEPDENDEFGFDFFVPASDQVVFVYAYLRNIAKKRGKHQIGWTLSAFYDLSSIAGDQRTANLVPQEVAP